MGVEANIPLRARSFRSRAVDEKGGIERDTNRFALIRIYIVSFWGEQCNLRSTSSDKLILDVTKSGRENFIARISSNHVRQQIPYVCRLRFRRDFVAENRFETRDDERDNGRGRVASTGYSRAAAEQLQRKESISRVQNGSSVRYLARRPTIEIRRSVLMSGS